MNSRLLKYKFLPLFPLCILTTIFFAVIATAEPISLYEVALPVDSAVPVEDPSAGAVRVIVGGREEILSLDEAPSWAFNVIVSTPAHARKISIDQYSKILAGASRDHAQSLVRSALLGLTYHLSSDRSEVVDLFKETYRNLGITSVFQSLFETRQKLDLPSVISVYCFIVVGLSDSSWARSNFTTLSVAEQAELPQMLRENTISDLMLHRWVDAQRGLELEELIYRSDDSTFKKLRLLAERIANSLKDAGQGDFESLLSLGELAKGDQLISPIVAPLVLDRIQVEVGRLLDIGLPQRALNLLARTDPDFRSETTHTLIERIISSYLNAPETQIEASAHIYLSAVAAKDPSLADLFKGLLESKFNSLRAEGDFDGAEKVITLVQGLAGEDRLADRMRVVVARDYLGRGQRVYARRALSGLSSELPLFERLSFFLSGFYGDHILWLMLGLVPVILGWFYFARARRIEQVNTNLDDIILGWHAPKTKVDSIIDPIQSSSSILSPAMQEYNRCLSDLGLKPGASIRAIKGRYRELIKRVHPDLNSNIDEKGKDRFTHLTQIYDKIVQLRRELKIQL